MVLRGKLKFVFVIEKLSLLKGKNADTPAVLRKQRNLGFIEVNILKIFNKYKKVGSYLQKKRKIFMTFVSTKIRSFHHPLFFPSLFYHYYVNSYFFFFF